MYSRNDASRLRQEFWTAFGRYMGPVLSAEGEKINWINYRTGEKNILFRMEAGNRSASIAIVLTHADAEIQQIYFEQFKQLKQLFHAALGEEWIWKLHDTDEFGKTVSRIYREITDVSLFRETDWPTLISFFKERIVALDAFWSNVKYGFEALR